MANSVRGLESGSKAALLISECQRGMVDTEMAINMPLAEQASARGMINNIVMLSQHCRQHAVPVIFNNYVPPAGFEGYATNNAINVMVKRDGRLQPGSVYAELHPQLIPEAKDLVIERSAGLSLFHGTNLQDELSRQGVSTLILAGVSTNIALFATALEAVNLGYRVVLAEDCSAGATPETHQFQITEQFPLLAAVSDSASIIAALSTNQ